MKEPVYVNKSEPSGKPGDGQCGGLCACFDSPDGTKKVVTHKPPRFYLKGSFIWIFIDIEKYPYDNRLYNIEDDPGAVTGEKPILSFETRSRIVFFQSRASRQEQEFVHLISGFGTRSRILVMLCWGVMTHSTGRPVSPSTKGGSWRPWW